MNEKDEFTVVYTTSNGTAIDVDDYISSTGILTFGGDNDNVQQIQIKIAKKLLLKAARASNRKCLDGFSTKNKIEDVSLIFKHFDFLWR